MGVSTRYNSINSNGEERSASQEIPTTSSSCNTFGTTPDYISQQSLYPDLSQLYPLISNPNVNPSSDSSDPPYLSNSPSTSNTPSPSNRPSLLNTPATPSPNTPSNPSDSSPRRSFHFGGELSTERHTMAM